MALYSVRLKPRGYREEDEQVWMAYTPATSIADTWHQHLEHQRLFWAAFTLSVHAPLSPFRASHSR